MELALGTARHKPHVYRLLLDIDPPADVLRRCFLTCCKAALAPKASADSAAIETSAVGAPVVGMVADERRGVEVRANSSGGVPEGKTLRSSAK